MKLLVVIPIALLLSGCFSQPRSETTKTDRITFQAQVPVPTAEGVKVVPVTSTIRRVGTESEESHAGPDTEAITQAVRLGWRPSPRRQPVRPFPGPMSSVASARHSPRRRPAISLSRSGSR